MAASFVKDWGITQCSICQDTYKEPKALPCLHTFCLKCLDNYCQNKKQKDHHVSASCPLCRATFTIPARGIKDLPTNFFILQLLKVKQSTCEAESEAINKPTVCELPSVERININMSYCDQHPAEQNRLYCHDCNLVACYVCILDKHTDHKLMDVQKKKKKKRKKKKTAEKFSEKLKDDIDKLTTSTLEKQNGTKQLETDTSLFMKKIQTAESEISEKCDQYTSLIQSHQNQLMKELNEYKDKLLKDKQSQKKIEMERQFLIEEGFKRDSLNID